DELVVGMLFARGIGLLPSTAAGDSLAKPCGLPSLKQLVERLEHLLIRGEPTMIFLDIVCRNRMPIGSFQEPKLMWNAAIAEHGCLVGLDRTKACRVGNVAESRLVISGDIQHTLGIDHIL